MITYAERECFHADQMRILVKAQALIVRVADTWGNELRCHELARAVHAMLEEPLLEVVDGHCGPVEHSWLRFVDGTILDPYVPGRLPAVQIVDSIVAGLYRSSSPRTDIRDRIIDQLLGEMRVLH